jgi:hypothetical protein
VEKPERSIYTPLDFKEWREAGTLDLTPKFQRRGVWSPSARSFFVDTLLRRMPIPPIYIRLTQHENKKGIVRQVVDGQQRLSSILDFCDSKFQLSKTLGAPWAGKWYEDLKKEEKATFDGASFSAEIFRRISDLEVLESFARLNTYSVALNAQELRNGKYFGLFKQSAYALAYEHLECWRRNGIFAERSIARMLEVELTSELIISHLVGMQDKKKSIEDFYSKYDESFPEQQQISNRFREIIDLIGDTVGDALGDTEFHRPPLFYTLYCVVLHRLFGLPKAPWPRTKVTLSKTDKLSLANAVRELSAVVANGREGEKIPKTLEAFVTACLRQTDNIKPRNERFRALYSKAFGS